MYAILADIHGNLYALRSVIEDMCCYEIKGIILLGDLIDYGMQSNEVIEYFREECPYDILCNIWGNHERAIVLDDYSRFSSKRGVDCAKYTATIISDTSKRYLIERMNQAGKETFELNGKRCLAIHGSLDDPFWKSIGVGEESDDYAEYDMVFSAHSHFSHIYTGFFKSDDPVMRNKKNVRFINPGSVGQPRNHNPNAQYALLDENTMSIYLRAVQYNIDGAASRYDGSVDSFYKTRLYYGV